MQSRPLRLDKAVSAALISTIELWGTRRLIHREFRVRFPNSAITSDSALRKGVFPAVSAKEEILAIKELATHLRVHPTTIYRLLRQGHLPGFRVGSNWRFRRSLIEQWQISQPSERLMPIARGRKKRR
jgi:excisionase family DNA binding protein